MFHQTTNTKHYPYCYTDSLHDACPICHPPDGRRTFVWLFAYPRMHGRVYRAGSVGRPCVRSPRGHGLPRAAHPLATPERPVFRAFAAPETRSRPTVIEM